MGHRQLAPSLSSVASFLILFFLFFKINHAVLLQLVKGVRELFLRKRIHAPRNASMRVLTKRMNNDGADGHCTDRQVFVARVMPLLSEAEGNNSPKWL